MERDIGKDCNAAYPDCERRSSKSVQYFTFGKGNCLVHHPTSQNKQSSSSAIFCRTNPFQTQANKIIHRKIKSTLPLPEAKVRHTPHTHKQQRLAISKLGKNLKQANESSAADSDFLSIVIEGKSLNLNPKNYNGQCTNDTSTYYKNIKRCKMCGKVMLGLDSLLSRISKHGPNSDFCSDCKSNKISSSIDFEEKNAKFSHDRKSKIKRCVMCSKLFIQPYNSTLCEKCPNIARFKTHEDDLLMNMTATSNFKQNSSSTTLPKNVVSSIGSHTNSKAAQGAKFPSSPNNEMDKLTQPNIINEHSKRKTNIACKKTSNAKSNLPTQTKSRLETHQLTTKSNYPNEEIALGSGLSPEQSKNTNLTSKKASVKKSSIDTIAKSLSEANRSSVRSKNNAEKLSSESYLYRNQYDNSTNMPNSKTLSRRKSRPPQTRSLPETNQTVSESKSTTENFPSKSYFDKHQPKDINIENKKVSIERRNVPTQVQSLPVTNQLFTTVGNTSEEFISEIVIDIAENPNASISSNRASVEEINMPIQTESLIETNSTAAKAGAEAKCTQSYIDKQNIPSTNKSISTRDSNMPAQSKSLSKTKQITEKSKDTPEKVTAENYINSERCRNTNMASKSTSTDKLNTDTETQTETSQLEQDFLLKLTNILNQNKEISSSEQERPSSPVLQNVTVNNYYFLTGSNLKKVLCNSSVGRVPHNFSPADYSSSESISLVSEDEDKLCIDKVKENENPVNPENSEHPSLQPELTKSIFEELCGIFKHNADVPFLDSSQSQCDISLYNGSCSILKRAQCLYGVKSIYPYIRKSLMIFDEMDRVRNECIDPEKILEELKKNKDLMKVIDQMAAKKLNFPRKSTVFKDLTAK